eukprot:g171.t1
MELEKALMTSGKAVMGGSRMSVSRQSIFHNRSSRTSVYNPRQSRASTYNARPSVSVMDSRRTQSPLVPNRRVSIDDGLGIPFDSFMKRLISIWAESHKREVMTMEGIYAGKLAKDDLEELDYVHYKELAFKLIPSVNHRECLHQFMEESDENGLTCDGFVLAMLNLKFHRLEIERVEYLKTKTKSRQSEYESSEERKSRMKRRRHTRQFMHSAVELLQNSRSRKDSIRKLAHIVDDFEGVLKGDSKEDNFATEVNRRLSLSHDLKEFYTKDDEDHSIRHAIEEQNNMPEEAKTENKDRVHGGAHHGGVSMFVRNPGSKKQKMSTFQNLTK